MSDYLFSSTIETHGRLSKALIEIYTSDPPESHEYFGTWGSLAITKSHYHGFQPYENDLHMMVVIGGPVLYFRNNDFLIANDSNEATEAIYKKWIIDKKIQWDEDLSGPFTILLINKEQHTITVITDLMAFIPVYSCHQTGKLYLGTHIDALAKVAGEQERLDQVSLADFVLNDVITYPYTAYKNLKQLPPSSVTSFIGLKNSPHIQSYWTPNEVNPYTNIKLAADSLRDGISNYVSRVTEKMTKVAQFISAGEDSRSLSGMLPESLERDAFIYLDNMNREGKIAKRVADVYGANYNVHYRSPTHYLDILPEARKLIGTGHQYGHAHSLGFDKVNKLATYSAVFGGYLSDSLLKAAFTRKIKGISRLPFLPEFYLKGESRTKPISSAIINANVLAEVNNRRLERFKSIKEERPLTAHEWFVLRPATMRVAIPNLYTTRRLFRSYEPFMCKEAVKISAAVPTSWKLNRRLFNLTMKPFLQKSKWLFHADGRLPYFNYLVNIPIQSIVWTYQQLAQRTGLIKGNQGPWGDWKNYVSSPKWLKMVNYCKKSKTPIYFIKEDIEIEQALTTEQLSTNQKVNLMQVVYSDK